MPTITVPIIAQSVQSTTAPLVLCGMIGTLNLVLNNDNSFASGTVTFIKVIPPLVAQTAYAISQVGTTPVIQNGTLQFQLADAASLYPPVPPAQAKSKPPFSFTGQIDLVAQTIAGQAAWLPPGLVPALAARSTIASGNFTQSSISFSNPPSNRSMLSLPVNNLVYSQQEGATEVAPGDNGQECNLQLYVAINTVVPQDATFYLNVKGGVSTPLDISVSNSGFAPVPIASAWQPPSSDYAWSSWIIPSSLLTNGSNSIKILNAGDPSVEGTMVYIRNVAVVW
jgi:hypothetical protein